MFIYTYCQLCTVCLYITWTCCWTESVFPWVLLGFFNSPVSCCLVFTTGHQLSEESPLLVSVWLESFVQPGSGAPDHAAVCLCLPLPQRCHQPEPTYGGTLHAAGRYWDRNNSWFDHMFKGEFVAQTVATGHFSLYLHNALCSLRMMLIPNSGFDQLGGCRKRHQSIWTSCDNGRVSLVSHLLPLM